MKTINNSLRFLRSIHQLLNHTFGAFTLPDSDSDKVSDNITVHSYGHPHQNRQQNRNRIGQCEHTVEAYGEIYGRVINKAKATLNE